MKKPTLLVLCLLLLALLAALTSTVGRAVVTESAADEQWEYLVVAAPSRTNFSPTGNSGMRKETGNFGQEAFVLEQQLDKVGTKGWELVAIAGPPTDPIYYFKRHKRSD
jgi:ABC-type sugar transport system substrate-binding protein